MNAEQGETVEVQTDVQQELEEAVQAIEAAWGGGVRNPYPQLAELRRKGAVHPTTIREAFGIGEDVDLGILFGDADPPPCFNIVQFDTVWEGLRNAALFSSLHYTATLGPTMGRSILMLDEPEHHRHRQLIQQAFAPKAVERWKDSVVHPVVHATIDRFADAGRADLVREFTFVYPVRVISGILGLPEENVDRFHVEGTWVINFPFDPPRGFAATQYLREHFTEELAKRREQPGEDLLTRLAHAEWEGSRLSDEEILPFLLLLFPAGAETTFRVTGNLLFGLLSNPDQLEAVRQDRGLIPQAIEEAIRWESPLNISRLVTRDVEIDGTAMVAGSLVTMNLFSANHDESRWDNAEAFDIFREPKPHLGFAAGPHTCIGLHLARLEIGVALDALLDRLPNLRLDPDADDVHIHGAALRGPQSLPVLFG